MELTVSTISHVLHVFWQSGAQNVTGAYVIIMLVNNRSSYTAKQLCDSK